MNRIEQIQQSMIADLQRQFPGAALGELTDVESAILVASGILGAMLGIHRAYFDTDPDRKIPMPENLDDITNPADKMSVTVGHWLEDYAEKTRADIQATELKAGKGVQRQ